MFQNDWGGSVFLSSYCMTGSFYFLRHKLQYWTQNNLTYPIFFLTYVASSTIDYVKSFLEWMSDSIAKSFEHTRDNAFLLR